jgi:hypothetical protein
MRIRTHVLTVLMIAALSPAAFAYVPWVNRHNACQEAFDLALPAPKSSVTNFVFTDKKINSSNQLDLAVRKSWGYINAYPATNGKKAGIFITGNGGSYFVELPAKREVSRSLDLEKPLTFPLEADGSTVNTWLLKVNTPDHRLPLVVKVKVHTGAHSTKFSVSPFHKLIPEDRSYDGIQEVTATAEAPAEAEQQSADVLIDRIKYTQNQERHLGVTALTALQKCNESLSPRDSEDVRVITAMGEVLRADLELWHKQLSSGSVPGASR